MDLRTDGNVSTELNGIEPRFVFSDDAMQKLFNAKNSDTEYKTYASYGQTGKEIVGLLMAYNDKPGNIWYIKNVEIIIV